MMWSVPRLTDRLKILQFKLEWKEICDDAYQKVENVVDTLTEIESETFKEILKYVLSFANTLAGKGGPTNAFTLNSLTKLKDFKSPVEKNMTLLHFLVRIFKKENKVLEWINKNFSTFKNSQQSIATFQGVFPHILENLLDIEKELYACGSSDIKYSTNLLEFKTRIINESVLLNQKRKDIDLRIAFLGSNKNDLPDDDNVRQIRAMWNKYTKIMPEDQVKSRIEHDEGTYTFFCNLVTFSSDVIKAETYLESISNMDKEPNPQGKRGEPPSAAALKKKLAEPPGSTSLPVPTRANRQASVFRKPLH